MRFDAVAARALLLAGAALVPAAALHAQDAAPASPAAEEQADETMDDGNAIVVTATKREKTLQDVPVAVSVTTAATIERAQIRDVKDLATLVPSLKVSQSQSQAATTYSIRGFGTSGNNIGLEPSVAMFVDGVYRSRAIGQISDLPDIQRVEVLRGPQSTLFGKNASAGVISLVTKKPSFDFGGSLEASYGNYNAFVGKGYLTGPLGESVAASIAAGYNRRDGYLTNGANGDDLNDRNRWFARGQVLFEPGNDFSFRLIGDYDQIDEKCCGVTTLKVGPFTQALLAVGGKAGDPNRPFDDIVYSDVVPFSKVKNWGVSGQGDYSFGNLKLTSITAYRNTKMDANQDVDFTSAPAATGANIGQVQLDTFTQELRLTSDFDGPLNFLLGGYYFNEKATSADQIVYGSAFRPYVNLLVQQLTKGTQNVASLEATIGTLQGNPTLYTGKFFAAGQGFFNSMHQSDEAWSVFGNVDFEITPALTLTLGGNYTKDAKNVVTNSNSTDVFAGVDLTKVGQTAIYQQALATQVGVALGLPAGTLATAAQIGALAAGNPTAFAQINAGVTAFAAANASNPAVNPLLALRPLQFLPPFQNCPNPVETCRTRDDKFTWNARLAYEISDTLNVYASYATGFKASSFNLSRDARPTAAALTALKAQNLAVTNLVSGTRFAAPENSTVYEVGIKGNWDVASANLTVFQQNIKDFQANSFTGTGFAFSNAGEQSTFGIEFDGMVKPVRPLTLSLAMTYLDPKYDSFVGSPLGDLSGTTIVNIAKISAVFGAQWEQRFDSGDRLILRSDFSYAAPVQVEPGLLKFGSQAANFAAARPYRNEINDLNASITYALDMGLELSIWGRNVLNDRNIVGIFDTTAQDGSVSGYVNQPRTYGISARYKF